MIRRRSLVLAAIVAPILPTVRALPALAQQERIAFRVLRKREPIGSHVLTFERQGDGVDIRMAVDIAVKLGPIVLFRYTLRGLEQWRGGAVVHVETRTDDDGSATEMRADRDEAGLWVSGSKVARYLAPATALPSSHWNMAELDAPWINLQDGRIFRPEVARLGPVELTLADGRAISADHYVLSGDVQLELWYDTARRWTGLRFAASDGSEVRYEPI